MCCISSLVPCQCVCVHGKQPGYVSYTPQGCVCLCMCVQSNCSVNGQSALCTPLSVDLSICLSLSLSLLALVLPCLSRPLPSSLAPPPPPLSSSSSLAPPHTGSHRFFLPSLRGVYLHFPATASSPQSPISHSLSRCLIFVLCVNQASLSYSHFPPAASRLFDLIPLSLLPSPAHSFFLYSDCSLAFPWISLFLISPSVFQTLYISCCLSSLALFVSCHFCLFHLARLEKVEGSWKKLGYHGNVKGIITTLQFHSVLQVF